ncbi:MAG: prepilin-type N-terminal cleavage/methylation domain-containing protein, partial [Rhodospirillales bacterium]|nr:prepilin-type N-terminal cleavage/methylation domain-containing protein [Acetobacter sp.]
MRTFVGMFRRTRRRAGAAFTLAELLVVIAVVGVLAGLLFTALSKVQARGRATQCVANLRQWGVALNLYANDNDGNYPKRGQGIQPITMLEVNQLTAPDVWINALPPYFGQPGFVDAVHAGRAPKPGDHSVFVCPDARPSASGPYFLPYAMNMYLSPTIRPDPHKRASIPEPSQLAFLADGPVAWSSTVPSSQAYSVPARHAGRANVCFVDGHVASFDGA